MLYRDFYDAGFRIFPLWRAKVVDGKSHCECDKDDCAAPFKHPRISNWQNTPHWDVEQLDTMEDAEFFDTGYGVLCRGLLVVDVDARNGGVESLSKLLIDIPEIAGAGLVVDTGSGKGSRHYYFTAPDDVALLSHLPEYRGIDFQSGSRFVVGPGSMHLSGNRYSTADGAPNDIAPAPDALLALLRKPERHRTEYNGISLDVSQAEIATMLQHIPNDDLPYDDWVKVGMAIHQATGGTGYDLWDHWSAQSGKHDATLMANRWHSFGRAANPVTIGTLIYHAEQHGWVMPVSFVPEGVEVVAEIESPVDGLPFDIAGCDLKSPPGFVGDVARWIESQCRRPRATLATAAALTAIGNIAGLRYTDDKDNVTANLFCFCIAGSGTGKEAVQQAVGTLHRAAGISGATHGAIKSDSEIFRNLTRHQAAFYVIDEVGIFLQKLKSASQKGGAIYLEGVIATLMSVYSKGNGWLLVTGDAKEELKKALIQEMAQLNRKADEDGDNDSLKHRRTTLQGQLNSLDKGLERPFLSLLGFTTPETFDGLVDHASATNGFIGRSLLFNERDTAPKSKRNFAAPPLPREIEIALQAMYYGGSYDTQATRVEYYGEKSKVPTEPKALEMLAKAADWFDEQADLQKERHGLEALYLRAYEALSKASLVLALSGGIRTAEHVRWAFALVRRDIEEKARLVISNDHQKDAPMSALQAKIENLCSDDGISVGVLSNKLRKYKKDDIAAALDALVQSGRIERTERTIPRNGKQYTHIRKA